MTMTAADRRQSLWFFLAAFVVLFVGYGLRDPWPADEPRFVLVAKQMVESGDFLFPHRGQELYPDKPPLYFWLLSASYALIGSWRWSFLLPALLSGLGTLWLTVDLGRRLWGPRAGLWAGIAVLASVQFVYQFKRAQIDPLLVLLTTLAFYGLMRHALLGPHWRWYWLGGIAAGLGVIAKGVGFLPLLALLPLAAMARSGWQGLTPAGPGQGLRWSLLLPAFLLPILAWLGPVLLATWLGDNPERTLYLRNILFKQTAQRYVDPWVHQEPFWYFGGIILMFWAPFSLALPWLLRPWAEAWRARDARVWLPLGWALLVVLFFSLSRGKRDMYILPALPALALAAAPWLDDIVQRRGFKLLLLAFVAGLSTLLLGAGLAALLSEPRFAQKIAAERGIGEEARWLWGMLAVAGAGGLVALLVWRLRGAAKACAALLLLLWGGYGAVVHPLLDAENSARGVMQTARQLAGPDTMLGLVDWKEQNLLQAEGPVAEFGFLQPPAIQLQRAAVWLQQAPAQRRLLVQRTEALACIDFEGHGQRLGAANRREWWLIGPEALSGCASAAGAEDGR